MANFYQNWIQDKINANFQSKMWAKALDEFETKMDSMIEYLQTLNTDIQQIKEGGLQQIKIRKGEPNIIEPTGYEEEIVPFVPETDTSGLTISTKNNKHVKKVSKDIAGTAKKLSEEG